MNQQTMNAITSERFHQERKWPGHTHDVGTWKMIMEACLAKAQQALRLENGSWVRRATSELRQVAATGMAAMEQWIGSMGFLEEATPWDAVAEWERNNTDTATDLDEFLSKIATVLRRGSRHCASDAYAQYLYDELQKIRWATGLAVRAMDRFGVEMRQGEEVHTVGRKVEVQQDSRPDAPEPGTQTPAEGNPMRPCASEAKGCDIPELDEIMCHLDSVYAAVKAAQSGTGKSAAEVEADELRLCNAKLEQQNKEKAAALSNAMHKLHIVQAERDELVNNGPANALARAMLRQEVARLNATIQHDLVTIEELNAETRQLQSKLEQERIQAGLTAADLRTEIGRLNALNKQNGEMIEALKAAKSQLQSDVEQEQLKRSDLVMQHANLLGGMGKLKQDLDGRFLRALTLISAVRANFSHTDDLGETLNTTAGTQLEEASRILEIGREYVKKG